MSVLTRAAELPTTCDQSGESPPLYFIKIELRTSSRLLIYQSEKNLCNQSMFGEDVQHTEQTIQWWDSCGWSHTITVNNTAYLNPLKPVVSRSYLVYPYKILGIYMRDLMLGDVL